MSNTKNETYYRGFVKNAASDMQEGQPLDTALCAIQANNCENLYYGHFQVRVNDCQRIATSIGTQGAPKAAGSRTLIQTFGPFPLSLLKNGKPAPLYVECLGGIVGVGTSQVTVHLRNYGSTPSPSAGDYGGPIGRFVFTSTTLAWTNLFGSANECLIMDPGTLGFYPLAERLTATGAQVNAEVPLVCIDLYAVIPSAGGASGVSLQGFYAAEVPYEI